MPHMLGKELAERIHSMRPDTAVMYMSGYAQPLLGSTDALPAGMTLLEKPFTEQLLLAKARHALSTPGTNG
jgi:two-component system, cell cycle sensor histidine kinase and response regulator CckA